MGEKSVDGKDLASGVQDNVSGARKEKSCGGIIIRDGKVLMVQQENGVFAFPKGHVESGETELETAEREILEETGIDAELDAEPRFELFYHIDESDIDKTVVLFMGRVKDDSEMRAQEGEISAVEWVDVDNVENKLQFPEWKEAWRGIRKAL